MGLIKRLLGISELIELQKRTNELLEENIRIQKHMIDNDIVDFARKSNYYGYVKI